MSRDTDYNSLLISTTADNYVFSEILNISSGEWSCILNKIIEM